ncbi:MAG: sulfatase [Bacillota bacterium]
MNVVLMLMDTVRRDHLGFMGNSWIQTPALDRFAARSTTFTNAYIGSYPCMPARRDLFTGRYEFLHRGWGPLEHTDQDLPGLLSAGGKTSMLVTDHYHLWLKGSGNYHWNFTGFEFIRGQESDRWITDPTIPLEYGAPAEKLRQKPFLDPYVRNRHGRRTERDYFGPMVLQNAMDWVERNHSHDGFFLLVDCMDPHEPWDPPFPYNQMYNPEGRGDALFWPEVGRCDLTEDDLAHVKALYAGEVTMVDRWIGLFLDKLEQLGLMENTMVIFTSDHGIMLGEHGIIMKPWSSLTDSNLYQELAHVPLVIYHPHQAEPGRRVDHLVQMVDLFPTVLEAMDLPVPEGCQGHSLLPYLLGDGSAGPARRYACYGRFGEAINVTDGEWTLLCWPPGPENEPLYWYSPLPPAAAWGGVRVTGPSEDGRYPAHVARGEMQTALYHLPTDYAQQHDLSNQRPDVVRRLQGCIAEFIQQHGGPPEQLRRLGLQPAAGDV